MKAVGLTRYLPIEDEQSFEDLNLPKPEPRAHDVLVETHAIAVNPMDVKVRSPKDKVESEPRILGWDASGVVTAVGDQVTLFKPGDRVYYAGDITRSGAYAQYQLVDERIVGHMPQSLDHASAAALPLTTITAYESLFGRLGIDPKKNNQGQSILIIGTGGGVGSIAIQLAKWAGLKVIATASREASAQWVQSLGADDVVNYKEGLVDRTRDLDIEFVDYVAIFNDMRHWDAAVELVKPQGGIVSIDDTDLPMDMGTMKTKAASLHWEFMFARSMHQTPDMIEQHRLLNLVADLIDSGVIKSTVNQTLTPINADNLRRAHELIETGQTIGKVTLSDWG